MLVGCGTENKCKTIRENGVYDFVRWRNRFYDFGLLLGLIPLLKN